MQYSENASNVAGFLELIYSGMHATQVMQVHSHWIATSIASCSYIQGIFYKVKQVLYQN